MSWQEKARDLIAELVERMDELDSLVIDIQIAIDTDDEARFISIWGTIEDN